MARHAQRAAAAAAAGITLSEEECEDAAEPNLGDAGYLLPEDRGSYNPPLQGTRSIYLGYPKRPNDSTCPQTINIAHRIVTVNTPRERSLPGKLRLFLEGGDPQTVEVRHDGDIYVYGTPIDIVETGHSGCGVHTWHYGEETFEFTGKKAGGITLRAEVDPDPDDGGDGQPNQQLTIQVNVGQIEFVLDPAGGPISAKTTWAGQEAGARQQIITAPGVSEELATTLQLVTHGFDPTFVEGQGYSPSGEGMFTKTAPARWQYDSYEELRSDKHPLKKKLRFGAVSQDNEICPLHELQVRPVFKWFTEAHQHGPGQPQHSPTNADFDKAWKYVQWKYSLQLDFLRAVVFDPDLEADAETRWGGGLGKKDCKIGTSAVTGRTDNTYAENWCAATLIHENFHGSQNTGGWPWEGFYVRTHTQHEKDLLLEVPAYQEELRRADEVGLPESDKQHIRDIIERIKNGGTADEPR